MHTAANPFPNSTAASPHDLRSVARAVKTHEVDPAVVADFKAKMAQLPPRIRPPLRDEKAPVGGRLRRANSSQKAAEAKGATTVNQTSTPTNEAIRLTDPNAKEKVADLLQKRREADNYSYTDELEAAIAQAETAVSGAGQRNGEGPTKVDKPEEAPTHPTAKAAELYPAACIVAARHEMAKENPRTRRLAKAITPAVVAVWLDWLDEDKSIHWISQNNELMPMTYDSVVSYVNKHRVAAERIRATRNRKTAVAASPAPPLPTAVASQPAPKEAPNTAVSPPDPAPETETVTMAEATVDEIETGPETTAVESFIPEKPANLPSWLDREYTLPRPSPGAALATLAALIDNEQLRVKGSVKLNLEIEFGGE